MNKYFNVNDDFEKIIKHKLNKNFTTIERISNGWTNFVFKATTNENESFFFRFPRNDFFSDALVKEVNYTNFVKDKISFKTTDLELKYDNGRPFSVHKQINGKNLYDVLDVLTLDKKKKLCDDICKFIFELQSINYLECQYISKLSTFLIDLAHISKIDNKIYDFTVHNELILKENTEKLVLNHGDLNPGNILINSNLEIEAILDFAFCSVSSNIDDLSRIIGRLPDEFKPLLIESFEKIFNDKVDNISLNKHIKMWNYVDQNYIDYMKVTCPDVVVPSKI